MYINVLRGRLHWFGSRHSLSLFSFPLLFFFFSNFFLPFPQPSFPFFSFSYSPHSFSSSSFFNFPLLSSILFLFPFLSPFSLSSLYSGFFLHFPSSLLLVFFLLSLLDVFLFTLRLFFPSLLFSTYFTSLLKDKSSARYIIMTLLVI